MRTVSSTSISAPTPAAATRQARPPRPWVRVLPKGLIFCYTGISKGTAPAVLVLRIYAIGRRSAAFSGKAMPGTVTARRTHMERTEHGESSDCEEKAGSKETGSEKTGRQKARRRKPTAKAASSTAAAKKPALRNRPRKQETGGPGGQESQKPARKRLLRRSAGQETGCESAYQINREGGCQDTRQAYIGPEREARIRRR